MQIAGLLHGAKLLRLVGFEHAPVLGPDASETEIKALIDQHGSVFVKPLFKVGIGKKGKAGLVARAFDVKTAIAEKERLFFAEHTVGNVTAKANGVTYEGAVASDHEVYFSISDNTRYRAPTVTLTHRGGVDIEDLPRDQVAEIPFEALTGLKAFVIANALADLKAPPEIISPLVQGLPRLWDLVRGYGVATLELNPIRLRNHNGRLVPVACDFKCGFDRDDTRWERLKLPTELFHEEQSDFEIEVNNLRTHQGQSDVFVINAQGTILAPTFGGGANSLVTEMLGDDAIISTDFGGNPPYEKMRSLAEICFRHWLQKANVLLVIGGRSNNTDILTTFRGIADALREYVNQNGPTPLFVVIGRGGPNLVKGMGAMAETLDELRIPYRFFGPDSAISEVVKFAQQTDQWMKQGGRALVSDQLGVREAA